MNKPLILAVEDDTAVRNLITTTLETTGITVSIRRPTVLRQFWKQRLRNRISCFWIWGFRTWMEWK